MKVWIIWSRWSKFKGYLEDPRMHKLDARQKPL
jgi:hypothetical protein